MAKILLVDDEQDIIEFCSKLLRKAGFMVTTAMNGADCLRLARLEHPDLILLDISMPDIDGGDVSRSLSQDDKTKGIPVVFLSGMITKDEEQNLQGRLCISKSNTPEELVKKIRTILSIQPAVLQQKMHPSD